MYIGVIPAPDQCCIPPGAVLVSLKICENCGFLFARSNRDKYCRRCHANPEPLGRGMTVDILKELAEERPLPQ